MKSILTVCIGNICRSPMAQGLLAREFPALSVGSAGIGALIGRPADPQAVDLMRQRDVDISSHIARQISQLDCQKADLILVMDMEQKRYVELRYPFARGKTFLLLERFKQGVPDPYKGGRQEFEAALSLIETGVGSWAERIKKITEQERQPI